MKILYVRILGIHCNNCIKVLKRDLSKIDNVKKVEFKGNVALIYYIDVIDKNKIIQVVLNDGYITKDEYISNYFYKVKRWYKCLEYLVIGIILGIIWKLVYVITGYNIFNNIPTIDSNVTYFMLIIMGLLTSIHCLSMCGVINMVVVSRSNANYFWNATQYNLGRVISYTLLLDGFV